MKNLTQNKSSMLTDSESRLLKIVGIGLGDHREKVVQILGETQLEDRSQDVVHFAIYPQSALCQSIVVSYMSEQVAMISGPILNYGTETLDSRWGRSDILKTLGRPTTELDDGGSARLEYRFPDKTLQVRLEEDGPTSYALRLEGRQ